MTDRSDRDLPAAVRLMWEPAAAGSRGPKRGMSLAQVVDAAVAVADADGLAAVSMARVAKELGFTTMSLYRYVDSKDTLLLLMQEHAIGLPPELPVDRGWRAALAAWARAEFAAIRPHPWFLDLPLATPPLGPNNMAWLERGLAAFADTAVPARVRLQLVLNLSLYVLGRARLMLQMIPDDGRNYAAVLARLLPPDGYPAIHAALAVNSFESDDFDWAEADFGFALDRLLDGYQPVVDSYSPARPPEC